MARKKNRKKAIVGAALVALSALSVRHADAASVNVDIQAIVVTSAIAVFQNQSLNFGTFTSGGVGGTVVITPAGVTTYNGGLISTPSTAPTEAIIQVKGKTWGPGVDVSVTNPTVNVTNGTDTMVVNNFNVNTNAGGPIETGLAMTAPSVLIPIGATLTVGAGQGTGTYAGTFTVQVGYQ